MKTINIRIEFDNESNIIVHIGTKGTECNENTEYDEGYDWSDDEELSMEDWEDIRRDREIYMTSHKLGPVIDNGAEPRDWAVSDDTPTEEELMKMKPYTYLDEMWDLIIT